MNAALKTYFVSVFAVEPVGKDLEKCLRAGNANVF